MAADLQEEVVLQEEAGYQDVLLILRQVRSSSSSSKQPTYSRDIRIRCCLTRLHYSQALLAQALQQGSATALADAATVVTPLRSFKQEVAQLLQKGIGLQEDLARHVLVLHSLVLSIWLKRPQLLEQGTTNLQEPWRSKLGFELFKKLLKQTLLSSFLKILHVSYDRGLLRVL